MNRGRKRIEESKEAKRVGGLVNLPSVLEPNLDLFGFDVGENGTLSDELLTAKRTWFWTFMVEPLQCFHLFRCVPNVLAVVQCHLAPIFAG